MTRMQRWFELSGEERTLVADLAIESNKPIWQVFDELYPEETHTTSWHVARRWIDACVHCGKEDCNVQHW